MNLTLFVYGTLKRGYWNHNAFCKNAVSIEKATVHGWLYELPSRIPVLEVPNEDIIAAGTNDPIADARTQDIVTLPQNIREIHGLHLVHGEIVVFENPTIDLPPIDRLEGFYPGQTSLYRRVLLPARTSNNNVILAWCYVASCLGGSGKLTDKCVWP